MTDEQRMAMGLLREAGSAVTIISPKELGTACPFDAQSSMKANAFESIDKHYADNPEDRPARWGLRGWE